MDCQVSSTRMRSAHSRRIWVIFCLGISAVWSYSKAFPILPSRVPNLSDGRRRLSQLNAERLSNASLSFLRPPASCNVDQMSSTDLAYIGDVVYELYIRSRTVWPPKRTADVQQEAVALVRAEHQSQLLQKLRKDEAFVLTSREEQILTRGRNAASQRNHNRRDPGIYQDATALEALVGYLYISDPRGRCSELFDWIEAAHVEFEV